MPSGKQPEDVYPLLLKKGMVSFSISASMKRNNTVVSKPQETITLIIAPTHF